LLKINLYLYCVWLIVLKYYHIMQKFFKSIYNSTWLSWLPYFFYSFYFISIFIMELNWILTFMGRSICNVCINNTTYTSFTCFKLLIIYALYTKKNKKNEGLNIIIIIYYFIYCKKWSYEKFNCYFKLLSFLTRKFIFNLNNKI
jgi:hypothetical protein